MDPVERPIAAESPERAEHVLVVNAPGLAEAARRAAPRVSLWCDDRRDAGTVPTGLLLEDFDESSLAGVDLV